MMSVHPEEALAVFFREDTGQTLLAVNELTFKPSVGDTFEIDELVWVVDHVHATQVPSPAFPGQWYFRYLIRVRPTLR